MVQIFITGDDTGEVTAGSDPIAEGTVFAFEWDFFANGFALPSDGDLEDPIFASWTISTPPEYGAATISSPGFSADWVYTLNESHPAVQDLEFGETLEDSFVIRAISVDDGDIFAGFQTVDITIFGVCFANETAIETINGPVAVEDLRPGSLVATVDDGFQPVFWVGGHWYDAKDWLSDETLLPVCISEGALGDSIPSRDLTVSQQHRMLVSGPLVELHFGTSEVLVAAKHLCCLPGVEIVQPTEKFGYFHVLCEKHQLLVAEGTPAESMFLGDEALHALPASSLNQLVSVIASNEESIPQLASTCRPVVTGTESTLLFSRENTETKERRSYADRRLFRKAQSLKLPFDASSAFPHHTHDPNRCQK